VHLSGPDAMADIVFVKVLEKFLARQISTALDDGGQALVSNFHNAPDAALAAKFKSHRAFAHLHMMVAHRGEAERMIFANILLVTYPNERFFQQADDGSKHFFFGKARKIEIVCNALPALTQYFSKLEHATELCQI